eukprot:scpid95069/ scgid4219/ 
MVVRTDCLLTAACCWWLWCTGGGMSSGYESSYAQPAICFVRMVELCYKIARHVSVSTTTMVKHVNTTATQQQQRQTPPLLPLPPPPPLPPPRLYSHQVLRATSN